MAVETEIQQAMAQTDSLWRDFDAVCRCGGRFCGSDSEKNAVSYLKDQLETDFPGQWTSIAMPFDGWRRTGQTLECLTPTIESLDCHALVWSPETPAGGLEAEVVDLGRGTPDDIHRAAETVRGRIVLVRHEYMFSPDTVHRRAKYDAAREHGAVGFLIGYHLPGDLLATGSSGQNGAADIPAAAITMEAAEALRGAGDEYPRVRLTIETSTPDNEAESLIVDLSGQSNEWIVLSAHIDGHPLGESAIDNATGLAAVLAVARAMAPHMAMMHRGLRVCLFNLEEWALTGSARYVDGLSPEERNAIALNVNLDSIAGARQLTALTSGFAKIEGFLSRIASETGADLDFYRPLMRNSDHYNFARHGIPAFRLVAGFDDATSALRYVLTSEDRVDKVDRDDLAAAASLTASIILEACRTPSLNLRD